MSIAPGTLPVNDLSPINGHASVRYHGINPPAFPALRINGDHLRKLIAHIVAHVRRVENESHTRGVFFARRLIVGSSRRRQQQNCGGSSDRDWSHLGSIVPN